MPNEELRQKEEYATDYLDRQITNYRNLGLEGMSSLYDCILGMLNELDDYREACAGIDDPAAMAEVVKAAREFRDAMRTVASPLQTVNYEAPRRALFTALDRLEADR